MMCHQIVLFLKKREELGEDNDEEYSDDPYYTQPDDYAEANPSGQNESFGWVNGVGILLGVAGVFVGIPPIF